MAERPITFIHVGKTGGTALKAALGAHNGLATGRHVWCPSHHKVTLPVLAERHPESLAIFFVRDPIGIFVSGFNSRKRKGQPRFNVPWSEEEARAFARFETPNALAEALSDDPAADQAMRAITHVRRGLNAALGTAAFLESVADRILFIGEQERLAVDFEVLRTLLRIDPSIRLPQDEIGAHRTPSSMPTGVSDLGRRNLRHWYSESYDILDWCRARKAKLADAALRRGAA